MMKKTILAIVQTFCWRANQTAPLTLAGNAAPSALQYLHHV